MKRFTSLVSICLCLAVIGVGVYSPVALAATPATTTAPKTNAGTGQALEIAPPVMSLRGNPGQVIKTQISLRNIAAGDLLVSGQINDFVAAGEDGVPKILLEEKGENPYSIKGWVSPTPEMLMNSRQIKKLPITITIPASASPGGHYGVIRFTAVPPELKGTGVSLSASLGSLVLITVSGDVKEGLAVQEFSINNGGKSGKLFESTPLNFVERIKNTGNTHEQPVGQVTVKDMFGKTIAAVNVNLPPRNILPASIRKFTQPLDKSVIGKKKLFGRYTANLTLTYGAKKQTLTDTAVFWVIPYRLIAIIVSVLIISFFALRYGIKRYNKAIIAKATKAQSTKKK